jgi:hypothetical protein
MRQNRDIDMLNEEEDLALKKKKTNEAYQSMKEHQKWEQKSEFLFALRTYVHLLII